ncbi:MAG TPA: glycosyltransferase family 2 protein [Candidatus Saccharimonadia bacterium]|nr:glycosyltransferase family 2 protein [Candidatus Saccharimonadia bacterium]
MSPAASVIVSTYNHPAWLRKALAGYAAQATRDFELVVADDGSRADTRAMLEALSPSLPFRLEHVWHPDDGFRKCTILNRAIEAARGEYLVFSDGDCIPRADFVATHLEMRQSGRFLSGGYFKLPRGVSDAITEDDVAAGRVFDPRWLVARGTPRDHKLWKLAARGAIARALDVLTPARASWNGHNASGWRRDIERVNGFDERMQYGGEDRELGERLEHAGVRGKRVRYRAIVVHLDHDRGYVEPGMIARNRAIRAETKRDRATWAEHGLKPGRPTIAP